MPDRPLREISRAVATSTSPSLPGLMKVMLPWAATARSLWLLQAKAKVGIREHEDEAAMGDALAVDHLRPHRHRQRRLAGPDLDDLHAETLAGVVLLPHRIRAGAREVVGRKRGLDVHAVSPVVGLVEQASCSVSLGGASTGGVNAAPNVH